jgi:2-desacetyl-2-hydroxyethyl bacteriochlorophyllide A dehydrogenase
MKAVLYEGNRQIRTGVSQPEKPGIGQVRIEVAYGGLCGTDLHIFYGDMDNRVGKPQIIGHEMSGVIAEVGSEVNTVQVGDRVTVMPLNSCGKCTACRNGIGYICHNLQVLGVDRPGAFQSSWTVPAGIVFPLPDSISLKYGALIEPLAVACHDLRMGRVKAGESVVVIGGGPIGALIAMVAQHIGARVILSEINAFRREMIEELNLGIQTVNPLEQDLVQVVRDWTDDGGADAVIEVTGSKSAAAVMLDLLRAQGRVVIVGIFSAPPAAPQVDLHRVFLRELQIQGARVYESQDFDQAIALAASGALPLEQIVTHVISMDEVGQGLQQMADGAEVMKILVNCEA